MIWRVAFSCSLLQCRCSLLQCVLQFVACSLQCVAVCVAACCSLLQLRCNLLQCCCNLLQFELQFCCSLLQFATNMQLINDDLINQINMFLHVALICFPPAVQNQHLDMHFLWNRIATLYGQSWIVFTFCIASCHMFGVILIKSHGVQMQADSAFVVHMTKHYKTCIALWCGLRELFENG